MRSAGGSGLGGDVEGVELTSPVGERCGRRTHRLQIRSVCRLRTDDSGGGSPAVAMLRTGSRAARARCFLLRRVLVWELARGTGERLAP